jgi:hypothetical protein
MTAIDDLTAEIEALEAHRRAKPDQFASHPGQLAKSGKGHLATVKLIGQLQPLIDRLQRLKQ